MTVLNDRIAKLQSENQKLVKEKRSMIVSHESNIADMEEEMENILKEAEEELKKAEIDMERLGKGHQVEIQKHAAEVNRLKLLVSQRDEEIGRLRDELEDIGNTMMVMENSKEIIMQTGSKN